MGNFCSNQSELRCGPFGPKRDLKIITQPRMNNNFFLNLVFLWTLNNKRTVFYRKKIAMRYTYISQCITHYNMACNGGCLAIFPPLNLTTGLFLHFPPIQHFCRNNFELGFANTRTSFSSSPFLFFYPSLILYLFPSCSLLDLISLFCLCFFPYFEFFFTGLYYIISTVHMYTV